MPNLTQGAGSDQLQRASIGHTMSQQQLEQNNVPSSLFNNDPLGITAHGSSGGTTNRENENDLEWKWWFTLDRQIKWTTLEMGIIATLTFL